MARAGQLRKARMREEGADGLAIFGADIMAFTAGQKQGGAVENALSARPANDFSHLALQHIEIEPPDRAALGLEIQRLQEERPKRRVIDQRRQPTVSLAPAGQAGQIQCPHGMDVTALVMIISDRRNIGVQAYFMQTTVTIYSRNMAMKVYYGMIVNTF